MEEDYITIRGACEHNLKNIDVKIPRNKLTVITGLSGSGKSSLAFDTLYAEGQRRYVESLSAYARQFLCRLEKPDVAHIDGLSPAISIEQKTTSNNPRSIVATTTEIHDYLRLIYGNIALAHCPRCGRPVVRQHAEEIASAIAAMPEGSRVTILAPVVKGRKGSQAGVIEDIVRSGFARVRLDGEIHSVDDMPPIDGKRTHSLDAVIDRIVVSPSAMTRITDSVELALKTGSGVLYTLAAGADGEISERVFSERNACHACSVSFDELKPRDFSFNSPHGACPVCAGLGSQLIFVEDLAVPDMSLSLNEGAVKAWRVGGFRVTLYCRYLLRAFAEACGVDMDMPYCDLPATFRHELMHGTAGRDVELKFRMRGGTRIVTKPFEGVLPNLHRRYTEATLEEARQSLERYMRPQQCQECGGARLKKEACVATVAGKTIVEVTAMSIRSAAEFFGGIEKKLSGTEMAIVGEAVKEIQKRLRFLLEVGLDYISLSRESSTLSGGEMQRIRLATQIGSGLTGVLYVLDEPTIGLHPRDNARLIKMLRELQGKGNTVVVVEHDADMIRGADFVIDLGPGAGRNGGEVVFAGNPAALLESHTSLTAGYLSGRTQIEPPEHRKPGREKLKIFGACENNLKNIDVQIPLGLFVCVTGVSGSGKSTLVDDILRKRLKREFYGARDNPGKFRSISGIEYLDKVIEIDQSPIGRTPRSNPATYTEAFTAIRNLFAQTPSARARGYGPGRFSFNIKGGRCETCKGDGVICTEMHFLPDVYVKCEQCGGHRYNHETLQVKYRDKNISEALDMTIDEACELFERVPSVHRKLRTLAEVGLGYLQLGQSSVTLSGGEAQRVKLATELARHSTGKTLYLLDEPTTGLHFADVQRLLELLFKLRDAGNTILMIEHNLDVIRCADYIIDLGPEGGDAGGEVVVAGSVDDVRRCKVSHTGKWL